MIHQPQRREPPVDNNKTAVPNIATQIPTPPNVPPQTIIPSVDPQEKQTSSKLILWLLGGIVIIFVVIGGIYWYLNSKQQQQTISQQPVAQVTPKPQETLDALDKDLSAVEASNLDSDFSSVDQDLKNL